ncbi:hypothetical protein QQ73_05675, partial [Candidatus Endoriftia persephone str. Guaymas]|nr:hypothetical protein [Candidatus Endoriftia persephone str. Guaymas]
QMGAFRGQGFGRLRDVEVGEVAIQRANTPPATPAGAPPPKALDLVLHPCAPFCVDAATVADNLFRSAEIIPGGVILGCIFQMLGGETRHGAEDAFSTLRDNLPRLRV